MRNTRIAAALAVLALSAAAPAGAGTLTITYQFDGGSIQGFPSFPADTVTGGTAVFVMPASGPATPSVFTFGTLQQLTVLGASNGIRFLSPVNHYLSPIGTKLFMTFAAVPSIQTGTALSNTLGPGGNWYGSLALAAGSVAFHLNRVVFTGSSTAYASVNASGQEVSRVFVPEPRSGALALASLGAVAGGLVLGRWRQRARALARSGARYCR